MVFELTVFHCISRVRRLWKTKSSNISFTTKYRLYQSLIVSILLYGCETWTLLAKSERRIQTFETKYLRKLLSISCFECKKYDNTCKKVLDLIMGPQELLLTTVRWRKLVWFGYVTGHDTLSKAILQETVKGNKHRGCKRKSWVKNVKEWTDMTMLDLLAVASQV